MIKTNKNDRLNLFRHIFLSIKLKTEDLNECKKTTVIIYLQMQKYLNNLRYKICNKQKSNQN